MPKTKQQALKQLKKLKKEYPRLKPIIIDNTKKFPKGNDLRYNFRFYPKDMKLKKDIYTSNQANNLIYGYKKKKGIK